MGENYTWGTQDCMRGIEKTQAAWACTHELLNSPTIGLVLLDELNIALKYYCLDM